LIDGITWTKASYRSARGPISTEWRRAANGIELTVTIPANTTATVYLPAKSANDIGEGGVPATKAPGVQFLRIENGNALFEIGSGTYRFDARSS
jgi:alpha-L-rhamnosidase